MSAEKSTTERILCLLRPFASNWSGTLSRGDLVIPQREIPRLVQEILESVKGETEDAGEASEREVFQALVDARGRASIQDQVAELRRRFVLLKK
jgi:hypothetical protein